MMRSGVVQRDLSPLGPELYSFFPPNSLLWGSLLGKKMLAAICSGHVSGACPPCVRLVSATCPPCVVGFGRASSPCPPLVRLVSTLCCWLWPRLRLVSALCPPCVVGFGRASALCPPCVRLVSAAAAPPNLVRHEPAMCPSCVRLMSPLAVPPNLVRHVSAKCPPSVPLVSALAAPPNLVRHVSALCPSGPPPKPCPPCVCLVFCPLSPLWPRRRLQTLSAIGPPCVRFGFPAKPRPLCVGQALYPPRPCVGFGRASKRCVSHVAAICPLLVFSLSSHCPLVVRSLSSLFGFWLGLAKPLSALRPLFGFCVFVCSVSVVVHLSRGLCGWAFARC